MKVHDVPLETRSLESNHLQKLQLDVTPHLIWHASPFQFVDFQSDILWLINLLITFALPIAGIAGLAYVWDAISHNVIKPGHKKTISLLYYQQFLPVFGVWTEWHYHTSSILSDTQVHLALRVGVRLPYSPQQVCQSGQHPAGPGCGRNGTCWQFQIAGEAETQRVHKDSARKSCTRASKWTQQQYLSCY